VGDWKSHKAVCKGLATAALAAAAGKSAESNNVVAAESAAVEKAVA
jgi:hypothetical protein